VNELDIKILYFMYLRFV